MLYRFSISHSPIREPTLAIILISDGVLCLEYSHTVGIRFIPDELIFINGLPNIDYRLSAFGRLRWLDGFHWVRRYIQ